MRKKLSHKMTIVTVFLIGILLLSAFSNSDIIEAEGMDKPADKVILSGEGVVETIPDICYINLGIITEDKSLSKAQEEASIIMGKMMEELKNIGVLDEDIKTINFTVRPKYKWNEITRVNSIIGYEVNNTVEVKVKDIDSTGNLLDEVIKAGGNRVSNIKFGVKDEQLLYNEALELAVEDARGKAMSMTKPFGIVNVKPVKISEVSNRNIPYFAADSINAVNLDKENTPINPGKIEIKANVNIEFEY